MRLVKKSLLFVYAGLLIGLQGCRGQEKITLSEVSTEMTQGGYVESNLELPEGKNLILLDETPSEGLVGYFNDEKGNLSMEQLQADGTWKPCESDWLKELSDKGYVNINILSLSNGEKVITALDFGKAVGQDKIDQDLYYVILHRDQEGNIHSIPLPMEEIELYWGIQGDEKGRFFAVNNQKQIVCYNAQGEKQQTYDTEGNRFAIARDRLYVLDDRKQEVTSFDIETGEEKESLAMSVTPGEAVLKSTLEGKVYLVSSKGVYEIVEGAFKEEGLKHFLAVLKELLPQSVLDAEEKEKDVSTESGMIKRMISLSYGEQKAAIVNIKGMPDLMLANEAMKGIGGDFALLSVGNKKGFIPKGTMGVYKNTENEEVCKEFILELISEENQAKDSGIGFPIHKRAFENKLKESQENGLAYCVSDGGERKLNCYLEDNELMRRYMNLGEEVNTPIYIDEQLLEILAKESEAYIREEKDLDETVQTILAQTKLYLME